MAKLWRKESIEEMQHADRIADRIIFLDGFPNMQVLDPLRIGLSRHRDKRPRALSGVSDPLPQRGGLRHARPVRGIDEGRGAPHRLARDPARPDQAHWS